MSYLYTAILFFNLITTTSCNKKAKTSIRNPVERQIILQSEIQIVGCGNILYALGFRFKVVENDSSIVGIIRCPDGYGEGFFKAGSIYKAKLTDINIKDSIEGFSLMNPYEKYNLSTYLVTQIDIDK